VFLVEVEEKEGEVEVQQEHQDHQGTQGQSVQDLQTTVEVKEEIPIIKRIKNMTTIEKTKTIKGSRRVMIQSQRQRIVEGMIRPESRIQEFGSSSVEVRAQVEH